MKPIPLQKCKGFYKHLGWSPGSFWTFWYFSHRSWKPSFKIRHHTNTNTGWARLAREACGGVLLSYFKLQKHLWHLNILLKNRNTLIRVYVKACRCAFVVETLCYWNEIANFDTREIDSYLATTLPLSKWMLPRCISHNSSFVSKSHSL